MLQRTGTSKKYIYKKFDIDENVFIRILCPVSAYKRFYKWCLPIYSIDTI